MSGKNFWQNASLLSASIGVIASIIAGVIGFTVDRVSKIEIAGIQIDTGQNQSKIISYRDEIEKELSNIKSQLSNITSVPKDAAVHSRLSKIESQINGVEKQIKSLNNAIMQSPEKALEVPMLKRDILSLQKQYDSATKSLEREIARAYDTMKWVIGTIVLGILGLGASIFLREREKT